MCVDDRVGGGLDAVRVAVRVSVRERVGVGVRVTVLDGERECVGTAVCDLDRVAAREGDGAGDVVRVTVPVAVGVAVVVPVAGAVTVANAVAISEVLAVSVDVTTPVTRPGDDESDGSNGDGVSATVPLPLADADADAGVGTKSDVADADDAAVPEADVVPAASDGEGDVPTPFADREPNADDDTDDVAVYDRATEGGITVGARDAERDVEPVPD